MEDNAARYIRADSESRWVVFVPGTDIQIEIAGIVGQRSALDVAEVEKVALGEMERVSSGVSSAVDEVRVRELRVGSCFRSMVVPTRLVGQNP